MSKYVIGVDPDSDAHGVAIYKDGKLTELKSMSLMQLMTYLQNLNQTLEFGEWIEFHIEDVCANNATFGKKGIKNGKAATTISRSLGKCQQSQIELERMIAHLFGNDEITKHKISKAWKDVNGKKQFQKVTGWTGRSNEDTRSAAYFGFLGL